MFAGERHPELGAVQERAMAVRRLLGVGDGPAGRHQAQFPRPYGLQAAEAVAVQHLALVQPADGLQAHVRMRRHLHPGLVDDVVGTVVVDEAPAADHPTAEVRQQSADDGALAERYLLAGLDVADRARTAGAAAQAGRGSEFEVAHGATIGTVRCAVRAGTRSAGG